MSTAAPPRVFVRFAPADPRETEPGATQPASTAYTIESVLEVRGTASVPWRAGERVLRLESDAALAAHSRGLVGVTQHLLYTSASERAELLLSSRASSGPCAVLIPIRKAAAWWALAQDERERLFRGAARARGHTAIGGAYSARIFRRLYHARYLPGSEWDFLTYFEFPIEEKEAFRALLAELRDPSQNPEWELVEAEAEVWMTKHS